MNRVSSEEEFVSLSRVVNGIWLFAVSSWGVGIVSRTFFAMADRYLSLVELSQLFAASLIFLSWLCFKPEESLSSAEFSTSSDTRLAKFSNCQSGLAPIEDNLYLYTTQARMEELEQYHMISQEYVFPFPYLCQIYHLLNLKHLEDVHSFSLNNLRIIKVSHIQPTEIGGWIKFQTVLESPFNTLRIWRQPIVEVDLILHTPYTVELNIPVYNDKRIAVIFNVLPLNETEHKLFIDIYSDLTWPKPILQILLHLASCLTVFEDFPYLRRLAKRNLERVVRLSRIPNHETMWLFRRFAELYGNEKHLPKKDLPGIMGLLPMESAEAV